MVPAILAWLSKLTTFRCNEPKNQAMRYRKFNVSAFIDAAVNAAGDDSTSCKILFLSYLARLDPEAVQV